MNKEDCKDCICLIEQDSEWVCDEAQKPITEIEQCMESLQLYDADPKCKHELDPYCFDGIRCKKCGGWNCY